MNAENYDKDIVIRFKSLLKLIDQSGRAPTVLFSRSFEGSVEGGGRTC